MLFISKKNDDLRLYIDCRDLNKIIKKNRYSLFLINEIMNRLMSTKRFIKINLKDAYYRLYIRENDE